MQDIERRLEALERTNRQYRLGLAVSLALLVVVSLAGFGQVGPGQGQTWPRTIVADSISVQRLDAGVTTINQLACNRARIQYGDLGDGTASTLSIKSGVCDKLRVNQAMIAEPICDKLDIRGTGGGTAIRLVPGSYGGNVQLFDSAGNPAITLSTQSDSNALSMAGKGGFDAFGVVTDSTSGKLTVTNRYGKALATIGRNDASDGEIAACSRNGNRLVVLSCDKLGKTGSVVAQKEGGTPLVTLGGDDQGGVVQTHNDSQVTGRLPSKD